MLKNDLESLGFLQAAPHYKPTFNFVLKGDVKIGPVSTLILLGKEVDFLSKAYKVRTTKKIKSLISSKKKKTKNKRIKNTYKIEKVRVTTIKKPKIIKVTKKFISHFNEQYRVYQKKVSHRKNVQKKFIRKLIRKHNRKETYSFHRNKNITFLFRPDVKHLYTNKNKSYFFFQKRYIKNQRDLCAKKVSYNAHLTSYVKVPFLFIKPVLKLKKFSKRGHLKLKNTEKFNFSRLKQTNSLFYKYLERMIPLKNFLFSFFNIKGLDSKIIKKKTSRIETFLYELLYPNKVHNNKKKNLTLFLFQSLLWNNFSSKIRKIYVHLVQIKSLFKSKFYYKYRHKYKKALKKITYLYKKALICSLGLRRALRRKRKNKNKYLTLVKIKPYEIKTKFLLSIILNNPQLLLSSNIKNKRIIYKRKKRRYFSLSNALTSVLQTYENIQLYPNYKYNRIKNAINFLYQNQLHSFFQIKNPQEIPNKPKSKMTPRELNRLENHEEAKKDLYERLGNFHKQTLNSVQNLQIMFTQQLNKLPYNIKSYRALLQYPDRKKFYYEIR